MGMHHQHGAAVPQRTRHVVAGFAIVLALLTVAGLATLWPGPVDRSAARSLGLESDVYAAHVVHVTSGPCAHTTPEQGVICQQVRFRLDQGPDEGDTRRQEFPRSASTPHFAVGDDIVLYYQPNADRGFQYSFADRQRRQPLLGLLLLFAGAVVLLGRWRGFASLIGLGASIAVIIVFVLPALLTGESPLLVATFGASAIAFLALYVAHGFRTMTSVALLGTLGALALTIGLAYLFTELTQLSGYASEESFIVQLGTKHLDIQGLVLAGMVLGALGAVDDVTVTQASAVWELREAEPNISRLAVYRAGLRIGRDHVASTVNTLALAYAGASLPLLIVFVLSDQSLGTVANSEVVATEIVRTLVGSIGLVSAVPVTTWLAAQLAPGGEPRNPPVSRREAPSQDPQPEQAAARDEPPSAVPSLEDEFWNSDWR